MNFFKRLRWGNWTDLFISESDGEFYLLQAKRRADGKLKFRVEVSDICWMDDKPDTSIDLNKVTSER